MAKQKARLEMNAQYSDFLKKQMNEKVVRKEYASQLKQLCTIFLFHQLRFYEQSKTFQIVRTRRKFVHVFWFFVNFSGAQIMANDQKKYEEEQALLTVDQQMMFDKL